MRQPDPKDIARKYRGQIRTAGEVRFIKDRSGDEKQWGWGPPGPSERQIGEEFLFKAKHLKPLAKSLRSALMALGHVNSAHSRFVKIKSRNVSPDGSLGGKGYIQKISDMRRQLMNCVEALSSFTDTVYDEIHAPHWNPSEDTLTPRDRDEVREIVEDAEEIKDDPEGWAEEQEEEMDEENGSKKMARTASLHRRAGVPPLRRGDTAEKRYTLLRKGLDREMKALHQEIDRMDRDFDRGGRTDWGYVGSMAEVYERISEMRRFLAGEDY
jgi:hypothetical protein